MAIIQLSTILNAPMTRIWDELNRPRSLLYTNSGMLKIEPVEPDTWPDKWGQAPIKINAARFRGLYKGWKTIKISHPPARQGKLLWRDEGSAKFVKTWDHLITLEMVDDNYTRFTDRLDLEAGIFTPWISGYARKLLTYRQKRWEHLVAQKFNYGPDFPILDFALEEEPSEANFKPIAGLSRSAE